MLVSALRRVVATVLLSSFCVAFAVAQTKVIVVPLGGNDAKPLANVVTVAGANGDFTDPVAALESIVDADVDNPYLVVIAPGEYELDPGQQLTMKPFVDVVGSGKNMTRISGTVQSAAPASSQALVIGAANSNISSLTLENSGGTIGGSGGIFNSSIATSTLWDVAIDVNADGNNFGIKQDGGGSFSDLEITVSGTLMPIGIDATSGTYIIESVLIVSTGGTGENSSVGVQANSDSNRSLIIRDSNIDAARAVRGITDQRVYVSDSLIDGSIGSDASKDCSFVFGPAGEVIDESCSPEAS